MLQHKHKLVAFGGFLVLVIVVIVAYLLAFKENEVKHIKLQYPQGTLRGQYTKWKNDVDYASFRNIPYALPPVGKLRFKAPLPAVSWEGVRDATIQGPNCPQWPVIRGSQDVMIGEEDCLSLNVFTPNLEDGTMKISRNTLLPVLVFVHGGKYDDIWYLRGSSEKYSHPQLFMEQKVVLIFINYRIGVFGLLALGTDDVPGNAAMKDQIMALRWVQENIKYFGGDPNNVTVLGQSSGAAAVSLLLASPMTKGLMHKLICLSAGMLNEWTIQKHPRKYADMLAKNLHLDIHAETFLDDIQNAAVGDVLKAADDIFVEDIKELAFAPVIEKDFNNGESFLTKSPLQSIEDGDFLRVPVMHGYASYEFVIYYNELVDGMEVYMNTTSILLPIDWVSLPVTLKNDVIEKIKQFYFGSSVFYPKDRNAVIGAYLLLGDLVFVNGASKTARTLAKYSNESVYFYRFAYRGRKLGLPILGQLGLAGATHSEMLCYIFLMETFELDEKSQDAFTRRRLVKMFTNFIKYGNPTPEPESQLLPTKWLPITKETFNYLAIDGELTPSTNPDERRLRFWRDLEEYVSEQLLILSSNVMSMS